MKRLLIVAACLALSSPAFAEKTRRVPRQSPTGASPTTVTINQLEWIEETNEPVPFATVRLLASGLDCEPVELVRSDR